MLTIPDRAALVLENYTFLTSNIPIMRTNVYAVPNWHILKGFSNNCETTGGESGTLNGFSETLVNTG
jgi:hypothetical protein